MNIFHNNRGSALVTVLLVMVIILIFSAVLSAAVLNSAKQTGISQKQIQATNLAEMGILYFHQYSLQQIKKAENEVKDFRLKDPKVKIDDLSRLFCSSIQLNGFPAIPTSMKSSYQSTIKDVTINRSNCNHIEVHFTSEGDFMGYKKVINGSFLIDNHSLANNGNDIGKDIIFPNPPSNFNSCTRLELCNNKGNILISGTSVVDKKTDLTIKGLYINGGLELTNNDSDIVIQSGNLYINGKVTIGNKSSILVQNGDAYFRDITGAVNGEITVNGDAYIFGDVTNFKTNKGNQLLIKVTGTVYVADNSDLPGNYPSYCNATKSRGICASAYSYISQSPLANISKGEEPFLGWALDEDSFEIEYK
ncbi:hypothetical protein P9E76_11060 [Schinkia azotoformans]|uniref:Uncharacterized protein n=1 Tax=Schinkia azotoformans LMG 9581 TaxID=1131731 RepID=K6DW00_SCHAZ|nr:hypothetical protein [Schinkia azotoformans]EKN64991.1 hypothetical protein BAZO_12344 [Schinkia azotoformans LMG 9581]MEC1640233.1 hypothetical protein [Schinkia azotoformans]MEC1720358.1 hypothetical protein [Schinkia azotoformans]MEC1945582.1 hypothetical protein [Schinkia azotoformans]MED4413361.1 hypothetical protein [Schinkia azotoformans]